MKIAGSNDTQEGWARIIAQAELRLVLWKQLLPESPQSRHILRRWIMAAL